jgi:hypothetical protein
MSALTHPIHHLLQPQLMKGGTLHVRRVMGRCSALAAESLVTTAKGVLWGWKWVQAMQGRGVYSVWQSSP